MNNKSKTRVLIDENVYFNKNFFVNKSDFENIKFITMGEESVNIINGVETKNKIWQIPTSLLEDVRILKDDNNNQSSSFSTKPSGCQIEFKGDLKFYDNDTWASDSNFYNDNNSDLVFKIYNNSTKFGRVNLTIASENDKYHMDDVIDGIIPSINNKDLYTKKEGVSINYKSKISKTLDLEMNNLRYKSETDYTNWGCNYEKGFTKYLGDNSYNFTDDNLSEKYASNTVKLVLQNEENSSSDKKVNYNDLTKSQSVSIDLSNNNDYTDSNILNINLKKKMGKNIIIKGKASYYSNKSTNTNVGDEIISSNSMGTKLILPKDLASKNDWILQSILDNNIQYENIKHKFNNESNSIDAIVIYFDSNSKTSNNNLQKKSIYNIKGREFNFPSNFSSENKWQSKTNTYGIFHPKAFEEDKLQEVDDDNIFFISKSDFDNWHNSKIKNSNNKDKELHNLVYKKIHKLNKSSYKLKNNIDLSYLGKDPGCAWTYVDEGSKKVVALVDNSLFEQMVKDNYLDVWNNPTFIQHKFLDHLDNNWRSPCNSSYLYKNGKFFIIELNKFSKFEENIECETNPFLSPIIPNFNGMNADIRLVLKNILINPKSDYSSDDTIQEHQDLINVARYLGCSFIKLPNLVIQAALNISKLWNLLNSNSDSLTWFTEHNFNLEYLEQLDENAKTNFLINWNSIGIQEKADAWEHIGTAIIEDNEILKEMFLQIKDHNKLKTYGHYLDNGGSFRTVASYPNSQTIYKPPVGHTLNGSEKLLNKLLILGNWKSEGQGNYSIYGTTELIDDSADEYYNVATEENKLKLEVSLESKLNFKYLNKIEVKIISEHDSFKQNQDKLSSQNRHMYDSDLSEVFYEWKNNKIDLSEEQTSLIKNDYINYDILGNSRLVDYNRSKLFGENKLMAPVLDINKMNQYKELADRVSINNEHNKGLLSVYGCGKITNQLSYNAGLKYINKSLDSSVCSDSCTGLTEDKDFNIFLPDLKLCYKINCKGVIDFSYNISYKDSDDLVNYDIVNYHNLNLGFKYRLRRKLGLHANIYSRTDNSKPGVPILCALDNTTMNSSDLSNIECNFVPCSDLPVYNIYSNIYDKDIKGISIKLDTTKQIFKKLNISLKNIFSYENNSHKQNQLLKAYDKINESDLIIYDKANNIRQNIERSSFYWIKNVTDISIESCDKRIYINPSFIFNYSDKYNISNFQVNLNATYKITKNISSYLTVDRLINTKNPTTDPKVKIGLKLRY